MPPRPADQPTVIIPASNEAVSVARAGAAAARTGSGLRVAVSSHRDLVRAGVVALVAALPGCVVVPGPAGPWSGVDVVVLDGGELVDTRSRAELATVLAQDVPVIWLGDTLPPVALGAWRGGSVQVVDLAVSRLELLEVIRAVIHGRPAPAGAP